MLGAQTRAAEYNAAKKASARQASREAEEQNLPPPAAPISLSAFTRATAQTNRNQGKKAYVPLVLEQTPEAAPESSQDITETPTRNPPTSTSEEASTSDSSSITRSRVMLPHPTNAPTMPRAMISSSTVPGGPANNMTPRYSSRPHAMPMFNRHMSVPPPQYMHQPSYSYSADQLFQHATADFAWSHMPAAQYPPWHFDHQSHSFDESPAPLVSHTPPPSLVARQKHENETQHSVEVKTPSSRPQTPEHAQSRFIFGPDDLSPSKQEMKTSNRKSMTSETRETEDDIVFRPHSNFERPVLNPIRMRDPSLEANISVAGSSGGHNRAMANVPPTTRPLFVKRYESEATSDASFQPVSLPNPLRRYTDTDSLADPPVTAIPWSKTRIPEGRFPRDEDEQEQYDRYSKMEKFVAVQQVLSRKGKTVLNNPERKTSSTVGLNTMAAATEDTQGPSMTEDKVKYLSALHQHGVLYPPPGLQKPEQPFEPSPTTLAHELGFSNPADVALQQAFGVMKDEWFDLKPVSIHDREKMQAAMKHVRNKDARFEPRLLRDSQRHGPHEAGKWMNTDPRRFQAARKRNDRLAKEYSLRLRGATGYDLSEDGSIDVHAGTVRAAGHMLANLSEYIFEDKSRQDYFNRTKSVSGHAIDRRGFSNSSGSMSLFEEKENVDFNSTCRAACDNRFPHNLKGIPATSEGDLNLYDKEIPGMTRIMPGLFDGY